MRNAPELCRSRKGPLITDKLAQELSLPLSPFPPPPLQSPPRPVPSTVTRRRPSGERCNPLLFARRSIGIALGGFFSEWSMCAWTGTGVTPQPVSAEGCDHSCLFPLVSVTFALHHPLSLSTLPASRPRDRGSDSTALKICT